MSWYKQERIIDTKIKDTNGDNIYVNDILESINGYRVLVCQNNDGFYGSLICSVEDSCRNVHYSIDNGRDYVIAGNIS